MVTLYTKATCPFSRRVVAMLDRLNVEIEQKDISEDTAYAEELVAAGGKQQVPFLLDETNGIALYESDDIVSYLQTTYGASSRPRVHNAGSASVCIACEG